MFTSELILDIRITTELQVELSALQQPLEIQLSGDAFSGLETVKGGVTSAHCVIPTKRNTVGHHLQAEIQQIQHLTLSHGPLE